MWQALLGIGTNLVNGWQQRKAKEQEARVAWEAAAGRSMGDGWKDEYVTVIITFPLLQIFVGNVLSIWSPERGAALLAANAASLQQIGELMQTPYGQLMFAVVLAAVGLRTIKGIFK